MKFSKKKFNNPDGFNIYHTVNGSRIITVQPSQFCVDVLIDDQRFSIIELRETGMLFLQMADALDARLMELE